MFSDVSLALLALFLALHTYGAHYTYSETPLGDRWRDAFGLARNPYDRFVHFACGLLATYPWRELAMRVLHLRKGGAWWLPLLASLAVSAGYELVESWIARLVAPELGTAFLGTQGDPWDAQKDMGAALAGTLLCLALVALVRWRTDTNPGACREHTRAAKGDGPGEGRRLRHEARRALPPPMSGRAATLRRHQQGVAGNTANSHRPTSRPAAAAAASRPPAGAALPPLVLAVRRCPGS